MMEPWSLLCRIPQPDAKDMAEIARLSLGDDSEPRAAGAPELNSQGTVIVDITQRFSQATKGEFDCSRPSLGQLMLILR